MSIDILLPAITPTMEEASIVKWLVSEGDKISKGDLIAEIETDKSVVELESFDEGVLEAILVREGLVKVDSVIATLSQNVDFSNSVEIELENNKEPTSTTPPVIQSSKGSSNKQVNREISLKAALLEALFQEMKRDPNVFYLGEDVGVAGGIFKQTKGLFNEFGDQRVIDTPISEAGMFGLAVGSAMSGMRPIVEIMFGDFITLVMDQLVNHAAKAHYLSAGKFSVPMVLRTAIGVGGVLGATHSQSLHAWLAHIPGLKVVMPSCPSDAKGLLAGAIRDNNPVIFFEDRMTYNNKGLVYEGECVIPLGEADVKREGKDVSIIAISRCVRAALTAADLLAEKGISAEVIDPRTIAPLDTETIIQSVKKTSRAIVVDGGHELYGITGEIASVIAEKAFDYLDAPVMRIGAPHAPIPYNKVLEPLMIPSAEQIVDKVQHMFGD